MELTLEEKARFDGGEKSSETDQYIERCKDNAINLHVYMMGNYSGCNGCEYQNNCKQSALTAGEQAEF